LECLLNQLAVLNATIVIGRSMLYLLSISEVQESNSPPDGSFQQCHDVTNLPEAAGLDNPLGNPNEEQLRRIEREEEGASCGQRVSPATEQEKVSRTFAGSWERRALHRPLSSSRATGTGRYPEDRHVQKPI
jgi:hypothetical protein